MHGMDSRFHRISTILAAIPIVAAVLILLGWQFRVPVLKGEAFGTFVAPNTALCFALCSISVYLQLSRKKLLRLLGVLLAFCVALFAAATLLEYLSGVDFGIDAIFFAHRLSDWNLASPGRFAFNSAIGFIFAGISLCALSKRGRLPIAEIFAVPVLLIWYLTVIGYLYSARLLYANVMAIHTGFLFGILAFAILFAAPDPVLASIMVSPYAGGILSRRILFAVLLLVPTFGLVRIRAQALGYVSLEYGTALLVLVVVTVFTILTLHTASVLNELDRKRQETESALVRSEKLAAAGRMAASVAHEINNPLEAVGNLLFLLHTPGLPEQARTEYLETAEQELNRVAAIARRTLAFYRETSRPTQVDLCSVIDSALEIYSKSLALREITVRKSYCEDARVLAAEGELHQIVANLISNAIDASPQQNARLDIMIRSAGRFLFLEIADNGQGIESANLARIFEPFFSTKQEYGTGLGLWITRELVARNRGTITVSSTRDEQNHGTTFSIMFPAVGQQQESRSRFAVEQAGG